MNKISCGKTDLLKLLSILAVAFCLISYLFYNYQYLGGSGDSVTILEQAEKLIPYHWAHGPLHPALIRLLTLFHLDAFEAAKLVSAVSALLMLLFSYLILKKVYSANTAIIMTLLFLLHPAFLENSVVVNNYSLAGFFTLLITFLLLSCEIFTIRQWFYMGLLTGSAFLGRGSILTLLISELILIWIFGHSRKFMKYISLMLGFAAPIVAWYAVHWGITGQLPLAKGWGMLSYYALLGTQWDSYVGMHEFRLQFESLNFLTQITYILKSFPKILIKRFCLFPAIVWYITPIFGTLFISALIYRFGRFSRKETIFLFSLFPSLIASVMSVSPDWGQYYIQVFPLLIGFGVLFFYDFTNSIAFLKSKQKLLIVLVVIVQGVWCLSQYQKIISDLNWTELKGVKDFLYSHTSENTKVACTAGSLRYKQAFSFVSLNFVPHKKDLDELLEYLSEKKVNYLVFLERHSLYSYPYFDYLLTPKHPLIPENLHLVYFVDKPKRAAVYYFLNNKP